MHQTITLAMIVRNEARHLAKCLDSVQALVDEIVIVDTGSNDNTLEIARRYTDHTFIFTWTGDFSAARNFAIAQATGDWILSLDADEELEISPNSSPVDNRPGPAHDFLQTLLTQNDRIEAYMLPLLNPSAGPVGETNRFLVLRLFRNDSRYQFSGSIHEQVTVPDRQAVGIAENFVIRHQPLTPDELRRKRGRNLAMLRKALAAEPDNLFLIYYLGLEWLMLGQPARALPCLSKAYQELTGDYLLFRAPALRHLLICLHALGRLDEAICLCLEASCQYPAFTDIYYLAGVLFEEKQEYALAVKWLTEAIKCGTPPLVFNHMSGSGSFLAYYHLGYCQEQLGQPDAAQAAYEAALAANPKYLYPINHLCTLLIALRGPRETLCYLQEKGYTGDKGMALTIAKLLFMAGFPDSACSFLEESDLNNINRPVPDQPSILQELLALNGKANQLRQVMTSKFGLTPKDLFRSAYTGENGLC